MKKLAALASLALLASVAHADSTLNFKVDLLFGSLSGSAPYGLEVDLSDPKTALGNSSVTLSNFVVTGGAFTGSPTLSGLVSGNLGSSVTFGADSSTALSYIFRDFDPSVSRITFDVSVTSDLTLASAHGLSFFVYDSADFLNSGTPYLSLDLNGDMAMGDVVTNSGSGVTASVTAVPEPSTYGLLGAGALAAVAAVRRRRKVA